MRSNLGSEEDGYRFRKRSYLINFRFQWKYTAFLLFAVVAALLIAGGPALYFLNQNYQIFVDIAYQHSPELLQHLEREQRWITIFSVGSLAGVMVFCLFLGLRMTGKIAGPMAVIEGHLEKLSRGHWHTPEIRVREDDEFQNLIRTYNYFYNTIRAINLDEVKRLKKIRPDRADAEGVRSWHRMIAEKTSRLSGNISSQPSDSSPSPDQQHAS